MTCTWKIFHFLLPPSLPKNKWLKTLLLWWETRVFLLTGVYTRVYTRENQDLFWSLSQWLSVWKPSPTANPLLIHAALQRWSGKWSISLWEEKIEMSTVSEVKHSFVYFSPVCATVRNQVICSQLCLCYLFMQLCHSHNLGLAKQVVVLLNSM